MEDLNYPVDTFEDPYDPDELPDFGSMLPVRNFVNPHELDADRENLEVVMAIANHAKPTPIATKKNSDLTYCQPNHLFCACATCQKKVMLEILGHSKCRRQNCSGCRYIKEEKQYLTKPSIGRLVMRTTNLDYYEISEYIENITGKRSNVIREGVNKVFTIVQEGTTTIVFNNVILARVVLFNLYKLPGEWKAEYEDMKVIQHIDSSDDEEFHDTTYPGKKTSKEKSDQDGMLANPMQDLENLQDRKFALELDEIFKDMKKDKEEDDGKSETSSVVFVNMDEVNELESDTSSVVILDENYGDEAINADMKEKDKENY